MTKPVLHRNSAEYQIESPKLHNMMQCVFNKIELLRNSEMTKPVLHGNSAEYQIESPKLNNMMQ